MSEKDFWLLVRRALLMIVKAIEQRYGAGKLVAVEPTLTDTYSVVK